jgi:3-oxoacyl-[acyl-carrier protein] reductase
MDRLNNPYQLNDKIILVTGANRGIGRSIAELFVKNGAVVFAGTRNPENTSDGLSDHFSIEEINRYKSVYLNVNDKNSIMEVFKKIKLGYNKLDCLVNNAGIMKNSLLGMINYSDIRDMMETNVIAPIMLIQYAAKLMKINNKGSIINISSIMGTKGNPGQLAYSATKGAIISITKSAAKELAQYNIRVNALAPGIIYTNLIADTSQDNMERLKKSIRLGRLGSTEDVAMAALFFASDASSYITGETLTIDGLTMI